VALIICDHLRRRHIPVDYRTGPPATHAGSSAARGGI